MKSPFVYRRKIRVHFYPLHSEADKHGWCALRITARWHGETLRLRTGERVLPQKPGKKGEPVQFWDEASDRVTNQHPKYPSISSHLNEWKQDVVSAFNDLWDAAPFEKVTKDALHFHLFPEAEAKPTLSQQMWRQPLDDQTSASTAQAAQLRPRSTVVVLNTSPATDTLAELLASAPSMKANEKLCPSNQALPMPEHLG
jgi:hypothetical protein